MNDTLDQFKLSHIESFYNSTFEASLKSLNNSLEKIHEGNISLDDSIFIENALSYLDVNITDATTNTFIENPSNLYQEENYNTGSNSSVSRDIVSTGNIKKNESVSILTSQIDFSVKFNQNDSLVVENHIGANNSCVTENLIENHSINSCKLQNPHLLSSWGLPELILEKYGARNITSLFDWQVDCLNNNKVMQENSNLVYSAPTSAGKTLIAEVLAIKCIFERKKKVIFILPFISVVREKMFYFQEILSSSGIRVEGFMGSYNPPGGFQPVQVAVGTIEKCNSLVNRLLEEDKLCDIGVVIIDEMHLIGDPSRGYILELLLTKLKYVMMKNENVKIQIIGMSATLPNLDVLAKWLEAELYTTSFRPIPLHEQVYVNGEVYNKDFKLLRHLSSLPELVADTDNVLQLCLETIENSCSVLIFCPTKNWCENLAQQLAVAFWKIGRSNSDLSTILRKNIDTSKITETLEQLKFCPAGLDKVLKNTVAFGVAFHHAGLTMEEREIVEGGFRNGAIRILIATSTLSSGVNLPARRVIIRSPVFAGRPIDIMTYRQMIGRAGRMGIDCEGESILICQKNDYNIAKELTSAGLKPVESCLEDVNKFKRAILEIIASGVASTPSDLELFESCTLMATEGVEDDLDPVKQVIEFLQKFNFIRLQKLDDDTLKYIPTALGKACLSSSMPPGEGLELFTELEKARQCFVLETELHLIYLVTPYSACYQWPNLDWMFYLDMWEKLPLNMKKVGELVGVRESFIISATRGKIATNASKCMIHKRFFVALALHDLVNEKSLEEVSSKFNCNRGLLQSLQQSASTFAGMVTSFSRHLGWSSVEILISQFQDRLQFGINRDLLDLMRLPILNGKRARAIFNSGIETLVQLANSDVCTIENILHKVLPFENVKEREGESDYDFQQRSKIRNVWITGKQGLTEKEAAEMILQDARKYLEQEMGLININWGARIEQFADVSTLCASSENSKENSVTSNSVVLNSSIQAPNSQTPQKVRVLQEILENRPDVQHPTECNEKRFGNTVESNAKSSDVPNLTGNQENHSHQSAIENFADRVEKNANLNFTSQDDLFNESLEETIEKVSSLTVGKTKRFSEPNLSPDYKKVKVSSSPRALNIPKKSKFEENIDSNLNAVDIQAFKNKDTIPADLSKFDLIDVCSYEELYDNFCHELLLQKEICLSIACTRYEENVPIIGLNVNRQKRNSFYYSYENRKIDGFAFTWDGAAVFYVSFKQLIDINSKKLKYLKKVLLETQLTIKMFGCRENVLLMKNACDLDLFARIEDPKVIDWMLDPDGKEKNIHSLIMKYCPEAKGLSELVGTCKNNGSIGLDVDTTVNSRLRAAAEVVITWSLLDAMKNILNERNINLLKAYYIEMASILTITKMEIAGIGVDTKAMDALMGDIRTHTKSIEKKIYSLANRVFSLTSHKEVARVLGMNTARKVSTNKQTLQQNNNPISDLILLWRKLNCILTKMLLPLRKSVVNERIHGTCLTHTATGRITMHEPNLQNVAKDFDFLSPVSNENVKISCRSIIVPRANHLLLSADYCQLEFRILTHLSQDELLCKIMNSHEDIFKSVAAKWNNITENLVTEEIRHQTKQLCYGIIYGMGSSALANQLKIEVTEATTLMDNFKNAYPAIKKFIRTVVEECKLQGYVKTIFGRRRYLPHIEDANPAIRSHAERQALNTTIQGSAADLVKRAMMTIETNLYNEFGVIEEKPRLILHLHDELLYEVPQNHLLKTAKIIKQSMESSVNLSVPFPVKIKTGKSWGTLTDACDIL